MIRKSSNRCRRQATDRESPYGDPTGLWNAKSLDSDRTLRGAAKAKERLHAHAFPDVVPRVFPDCAQVVNIAFYRISMFCKKVPL
jgi:hypothetical protein